MSQRSSVRGSASMWNCSASTFAPRLNAWLAVTGVEASRTAPERQIEGVAVPVQHDVARGAERAEAGHLPLGRERDRREADLLRRARDRRARPPPRR